MSIVETKVNGSLTKLNGHANGHTNGYSNDHTNGHGNGHSNGHANGYSNGHTKNGSLVNGHNKDQTGELMKILSFFFLDKVIVFFALKVMCKVLCDF